MKKAMLEKIVGEVRLMEGNLSPDAYKKLSQPTQKDRESLLRYMNGFAAAWSLASNAKQHQLVALYLEAMFSRKGIRDQFTNTMIAGILKNIDRQQTSVPVK